ncbi:hypothetical protein Tco_0788034 [Tanacetum coccineum]
MKMEHYLDHTDYPLWEVIQKGNGPVNVYIDTHGIMKMLPPKTVEETLAREREEEKHRTSLLHALPERSPSKVSQDDKCKYRLRHIAQLSDASIEILAYTQALKKVEAQLVAHQQGQLWYGVYRSRRPFWSYENEVLQSVFKGMESDFENTPLYERFVTAGGMNVVPPPMTGNYLPSGLNLNQLLMNLMCMSTKVHGADALSYEEYESDCEDEGK